MMETRLLKIKTNRIYPHLEQLLEELHELVHVECRDVHLLRSSAHKLPLARVRKLFGKDLEIAPRLSPHRILEVNQYKRF